MMPEPNKQLNDWERLMLAFGDAVLRIWTRHDEDGNPVHKIGWKLGDVEWQPEKDAPYLPLMEATRLALDVYENTRQVGGLN